MPDEFNGKVVVVSGASRGIGRGIALAFAREGAQTVLASSSAENLAVAAQAIAAQGPEPFTVAGDLRTLAACEQLFARVNERFGRCDVLVNNAGATRAGAFVELPDAVWLEGYAQVLRLRPPHQAVLAAVEGLPRERDQHHRWRGPDA